MVYLQSTPRTWPGLVAELNREYIELVNFVKHPKIFPKKKGCHWHPEESGRELPGEDHSLDLIDPLIEPAADGGGYLFLSLTTHVDTDMATREGEFRIIL
jgi:hypothetical protein